MGERTLIVGDIHGCWDEFRALLDAARVGPSDRIVAVGDLCDRGPDAAQVLRFFMERPGASSVMGNHEWKHVRGLGREAQWITEWQCGYAFYTRAVAWMKQLPFWIELPEAIVVHWGLAPGVALEQQSPLVLAGTMTGEKLLRQLTADQPWYDLYEGPKPVVFGHLSEASGTHRGLAYGLDTGVVHGNRLSGLVLPQFELISVPAQEDHWAWVRAEHADHVAARRSARELLNEARTEAQFRAHIGKATPEEKEDQA